MDWKLQVGISIIVPIVSSLLTYLGTIKKLENDIKAVKLSAENEINKIKIETDEKIRLLDAKNKINRELGEENLKNVVVSRFIEKFINNPKESIEDFNELQKFAKKLKNK